ncbi:MAG TPA: GNAT family N-acetyltransferase [Burkholderiaceae bacterium]|jgi:putative acetyltransferase|nr:GNAT family N-acetyltransferase [Burkholderiaceae bacterium]
MPIVDAASLEYRRAVPGDAEGFAALMGDELVLRELLQTPYPTAEAWRKRLEAQVGEFDGLHLVAVDAGRVVASAGLHPVRPQMLRLRHVAGLGICVARDWWGRGLGHEMMRRLLDWADRWSGYRRIELTVYTDNARAIALYRRHGFEQEGTLRGYGLRDGAYADVHLMARLRPHPILPSG